MRAIPHAPQSDAWNGYEGHHWAENQDRYDAMNSGMNAPLLEAAAIGETERVLDIGCGNGKVTRLAARQASRGSAVGIDLSAPMLDRARVTAAEAGIGNVAFDQGDVQVYPFQANGFDVAVSRCGIMFFADPVAAFANVRRALRPGGRLAFVTPQSLARDDDFGRALDPVLDLMRRNSPPSEAVGDSGSGMTSLAESDRIEEVLAGAGFIGVTTTPITVPLVFGRDAEDAAGFVFTMGPMRFNLDGVDSGEVARAREAVTARLRDYQDFEAVKLRSVFWLVQANRPA